MTCGFLWEIMSGLIWLKKKKLHRTIKKKKKSNVFSCIVIFQILSIFLWSFVPEKFQESYTLIVQTEFPQLSQGESVSQRGEKASLGLGGKSHGYNREDSAQSTLRTLTYTPQEKSLIPPLRIAIYQETFTKDSF